MSASTVSITANPAARRRPVLAGEKKSAAVETAAAGDAAAAPYSTVKDLSRSFSGEATPERERDAMKKHPSTIAVNPVAVAQARRSRRGAVRPEKPKWATFVSVVTKNLLLLLVLGGLVQMVRKLVYNTDNEGFSVYSGSEFEKKIADVEGLLKKTTNLMQVQVEVLDKKVENGLSKVRTDLNKKIDEQNTEIENKMKKYDRSVEGLERALDELKAGEWLKREDLNGFMEEFGKKNGVGGDMDLDEVRELAREIMKRELEKHVADGLGRADYAVASGGGMVVKHSEQWVRREKGWFQRVKNGVHNDAVKMLSPSFGEPGQCFPLKGSSGFVVIKLRTAIIPEAVTLEHVAESVAFDRSSAPKDCRISGWLQKHDITDQAVDTEKMTLLTEFTYDLEKSNAQTYNVLDTPVVVDRIRLDFTSNHGNSAHTCIYRMRVHGREPDSIPTLAEES